MDQQAAYPVILDTGLTGMAISRALAAAGMKHALVGNRPTDAPRLGESLNAEGSLEIARQLLSAAFLAADEGVPIGLRHLKRGLRRELLKTSRVLDGRQGRTLDGD